MVSPTINCRSRSIRPGWPILVLILLAAIGLSPSTARAQLIDITSGPLVDATGFGFGVAWADYNNDGNMDLLIANGAGGTKLFKNLGGFNNWLEVTSMDLAGVGADIGASWADYNNDGNMDLYLANANLANRLFRNDESDVFTSVSGGDAADAGPAQSVAWADYDLDGDVDAFVTYWNEADKLFRNDGGGIFVEATPPVLADTGKSSSASWADYDNDGDLDLAVGGRITAHLYRNDGGGNFFDVPSFEINKPGVNSMLWGDYDNDGDLDLYLVRSLSSNRLLRNDSVDTTTTFVDIFNSQIRYACNGHGGAWLDYNNDGFLDLFISNAGHDNADTEPNVLIRSNGFGSFTNVSGGDVIAETNSRGCAVADYDNNGYPDVFVANWNGPNQLLRNGLAGQGKGWLKVNLVGQVSSNWFGIGARVRIVAGGLVQIREIQAGSSLYSSDAPQALFGLGDNLVVDSLKVIWPSGIVSDSVSVGINQVVTIYESGTPTGIGDPTGPVAFRLYSNAPNPFRARTSIRYDLPEATFVDLRVVDASGRLVRTIESTAFKNAGPHEATWDGVADDGREAAKGVYFYTLKAKDLRQTRRMVLLR